MDRGRSEPTPPKPRRSTALVQFPSAASWRGFRARDPRDAIQDQARHRSPIGQVRLADPSQPRSQLTSWRHPFQCDALIAERTRTALELDHDLVTVVPVASEQDVMAGALSRPTAGDDLGAVGEREHHATIIATGLKRVADGTPRTPRSIRYRALDRAR